MKNILIPCDFSDSSESAFQYGVNLAKRYGSRLMLLHVNQVPLSNPEFGMAAYALENTEQDSLDALKNMADKTRMMNPSITKVDYFCETGSPAQVIRDFSNKHAPDLIVLGITWYDSAIAKNLFGSTSVDLARECKSPVVIVPPGYQYFDIKKIAYACDYGDFSGEKGLSKVTRLTKDFNAELLVVHVVPKGHELDTEEIQVDHFIERHLVNSPHRTIVIHEDKVVEGLRAFSDNYSPDILVIEPSAHSFFYRMLHKSIVKELLFNSPVPVLALH